MLVKQAKYQFQMRASVNYLGTINALKVHQNSFKDEEASFRRPLTVAALVN